MSPRFMEILDARNNPEVMNWGSSREGHRFSDPFILCTRPLRLRHLLSLAGEEGRKFRTQEGWRQYPMCAKVLTNNCIPLLSSPLYPFIYLGECFVAAQDRRTDIVGVPVRILPPLVPNGRAKIRFGSIGPGLDLPRSVWSAECQVFSSQARNLLGMLGRRPPKLQVRKFDQLPKSFLGKHPVDALLLDCGTSGDRFLSLVPALELTAAQLRPQVIVMAEPIQWVYEKLAQEWRRVRRKSLERLGYLGLEWFVSATEQGSAFQQERLMEIFLANSAGRTLPTAPPQQGLPPRAMRNLLMPFGVPRHAWAPTVAIQRYPSPLLSEEGWQIVGTIGENYIYGPEGVMPDHIGSWISDGDKGVRRLQASEFAKGKGLPSEWITKGAIIEPKAVAEDTCIHIWSVVCDELGKWLRPTPATNTTLATPPLKTYPTDSSASPDPPSWIYQLPDLRKGGPWHSERVTKLIEVTAGRPDAECLRLEGLEALDIHRSNYTEAGPKYLQVLWWEFPETHRDAVRLGASMRFMIDPGVELVPNPPLTPEQLEVVCQFVDELRGLGVVRPATRALRRVCPLFVVQKAGQPGQWRCIADMKRGGQNGCCSLDPIYLPSSKDILPHLYAGGWSAVADASKYFHNFLTLPEERDLIGIQHPKTGEALWYVGLPMGSVNSPSISCRYGEGILDMLRAESSLFRAVTYQENTWRMALTHGSYQPHLGHGYVGYQANGKPVVQVIGFVDDFKIHGSDYSDCCQGTSAFMDLMTRLGLICQPAKTSPPQQTQKYCGFLYDTTGTPTLRIPPNKISRCLASVDFLLSLPRGRRLSRLSLAIITGVLQSIVDATPQHIGQSYLRTLYDDLHFLEEGATVKVGADKYFTQAFLSPCSLRALNWWSHHLRHTPGSTTYRAHSGRGIVLKWGDGSGTGTGGTTEFYELTETQLASPGMELWMGVWGARAKPRTSNWKEARTVLESLLQERDTDRLRGRMVFYMTDNLVSYYIINQGSSRTPGLHQLALEIKELCLQLGCQVEVVHVPGTIMIYQGTDGQSRGLWMAPERRVAGMNQELFNPIVYSSKLGEWALEELNLPPQPLLHLSFQDPTANAKIRGRLTVWTPPPECGRQVIRTFLQSWVQSPGDTSGIFLIPRIMQRQWGRVAKYVQERGVYHAGLLPDPYRFHSHLPFVLLYVPQHLPVLRRDRMELPAPTQPKGWHKHQAEQVRGLS